MSRVNPANLGRPRNDPDYYRRQIEHAAAKLTPAQIPAPAAKPARQPRKPTEAENEYERVYLAEAAFDPCVTVRREGLTIHMANGHAYRPDFVEFNHATGRVTCHEVKGAYKLGSYQRARLAFDQCRAELPGWTWVWAEKRQGGGWTVDRYAPPQATQAQSCAECPRADNCAQTQARDCPWIQSMAAPAGALSLGVLESSLIRRGIIPAAAIEDADGYDEGQTRDAILAVFEDLEQGEQRKEGA